MDESQLRTSPVPCSLYWSFLWFGEVNLGVGVHMSMGRARVRQGGKERGPQLRDGMGRVARTLITFPCSSFKSMLSIASCASAEDVNVTNAKPRCLFSEGK